MELVTGYKGEEHVTAEQDADLYRGITGTGILNVGNKMKTEISGSTLYVYDGVCIVDGREIYIPYGSKDSISIPAETGSNTRTDLLVIEYSKQSNGIENAVFKLIQGTRNSGSDPPYTQADIRSGAVSIHAPIRERQQFYTKSSFAFAIFYTIIPVSFYKNKLYNLYNLINLLSITIISVRISLEIYVLLSFALQTSFLYHKF